MDEKDRAVPQLAQYSEAPASFNFPVHFQTSDGEWWSSGLTVRGNSGPEAIENLLATLAYGKARCRMAVVRPLADPPAASRQPAQPAQPAQPGSPAEPSRAPQGPPPPPPPSGAPLPRSNPLQTQTAPGTPNVVYAVRLVVEPKLEGKVSLNWYAEGHRHPDIYSTRSVEVACDLLRSSGEEWKAADLTRPGDYRVHHAISWIEGKPNAAGRPYKDIVAITSY